MLKTSFCKIYLAAIAILFVGNVAAQSIAKITIKKNIDGDTSEETRIVEINDEKDISDILYQMGVLDELGQLKSGQEFEINLQKTGDSNSSIDLSWSFDDQENRNANNVEKTAFLGVILRNSVATDKKGNEIVGAEITEVVEGTAAFSAELLVGDVIISIDDQKIISYNDVISIIQGKRPGDTIKLSLLRSEKKKNFKIQLGEREVPSSPFTEGMEEPAFPFDLREFDYFFRPDSITIICPDSKNSPCDSMKICQPFSWNSEGFKTEECPFLGITPGETAPELGVSVGEVVAGSCAEEMGLMRNDIITEINDIAIINFDTLRNVIRRMKAHDPIKVKVEREGKSKTFSGELGTKSTSKKDDFRIFHDFKGLDENGNYTYDFEFDMDEKDVEEHMEDLMRILEDQQQLIEQRQSQLQEQLEQLRSKDSSESVRISIRIDDASTDELDSLNKSARPKIEDRNTLLLDKITFFPNPTDGQITLSFQPKDQGDVTVIIYDSNGSQVYYELVSGVFGVYNNVIDLSNQSSGNYFLHILQNGNSFTKKIILEK